MMWRGLRHPRFSPAHRTIIKCKVPKLERRRRNLEPPTAIDTIQHDTYRLSVLGLWWHWVAAGRAISISRFRKVRVRCLSAHCSKSRNTASRGYHADPTQLFAFVGWAGLFFTPNLDLTR